MVLSRSRVLLTFLAFLISLAPCEAQESDINFKPSPLVIEDKNLEETADLQYKNYLKKNNPELSFKMAKTMKGEYKKRKEYFIEMLHDGDLIVSGELYNYLQSLLDKITTSVNIPNKKVFIVRDYTPNAFNMGDNNIFIHLGLIYYSNSEDELAYIIAHELGHNELGHYDKSVLDYVELEHNDSIKKIISKIKKSEYGRVSSINKLMIPWLLANKEDSRKDEYAADDYALNSVIEIGYDLTKIIEIYDVFENYGKQVDTVLFDFENLLALNLSKSDYSGKLKVIQASSLGEFKKQKGALEDKMRTHPFNEDRKEVMFSKMTDENELKIKNNIDNYEFYKNLAHREIIADALHSINLDDAIFYSLLLFQKDSTSLFVHKVIPLSFALLGYEKIKRRAGKRLAIHSPYHDNNYNQLLHFLREISPKQCFEISNDWSKKNMDLITGDIENPTLLIMDFISKNHDKYEIRHQVEIDKLNNYYLKPLLKLINTEYKNK